MNPQIAGESVLLAIAQIAVALAGFSGLVVTLRHTASSWKRNEIIGLMFIFELTAAALVLSLLPILIYTRYGGSLDVWGVVQRVAAGFLMYHAGMCIVRMLRKTVPGHRATFPKALLAFYVLPTLSISVVLMFVRGSLDVYLSILLYLLIHAGIQFGVFILVYTRAPSIEATSPSDLIPKVTDAASEPE